MMIKAQEHQMESLNSKLGQLERKIRDLEKEKTELEREKAGLLVDLDSAGINIENLKFEK